MAFMVGFSKTLGFLWNKATKDFVADPKTADEFNG
jgi:hypothetical protein